MNPLRAAILASLKADLQYAAQVIAQMIKSIKPMNPDALQAPWSDTVIAHHNVRAICDLEGLTFDQKEIMTACVYVESGFNINAKHVNTIVETDGTRRVSSTDFGIVQINDYYHIGPSKDFPSVDYVLANPEICVRWMARYYKTHGNLNAWVSFTSNAYKKFLGKV